jgi:hypothetical protein
MKLKSSSDLLITSSPLNKLWRNKTCQRVIIGMIVLCLLATGKFLHSDKAHAYNAYNAVNYADQWATSRNPSYYIWGSDCTNFASQVISAGGYPQVKGDGNTSNDNNWFFWWNFWPTNITRSNSWPQVVDQFNFQMWHYPGGWIWAGPIKSSDNAYWSAYTSTTPGDQLYYNWNNDTNTAHINHMGVEVNAGYSNYYNCNHTCNYGSLVDYHTTDRYHAIWDLVDVNPNWSTTVIWQVHIDSHN